MQIGVTCCNFVRLGADWCTLVHFGATCYRLEKLCVLWCIMLQAGATCCRLVQLDADCSQGCTDLKYPQIVAREVKSDYEMPG